MRTPDRVDDKKNANLIDLRARSKSDVTKEKKKLKTGASATRRDAPRKPTAGRGGSKTVLYNGSVGVDSVGISCSPWLWRENGKVGLPAATRHGMHSIAYQLRSWDTNKVDRGAGVYRTFQILASHVAIAQSRLTKGDVEAELL